MIILIALILSPTLFASRIETGCSDLTVEASDLVASAATRTKSRIGLSPNYPQARLALLVERGKSEAEPVIHPSTGESIKPERHLFLEPGDGSTRGDIAIAHDLHDGLVFQREALIAVYVPSAGRFKLTFELERFDRNGRLLPESKEQRREKGKCRSCHAINFRTGELLSTDPNSGRPDPNLSLKTLYERAPAQRSLPEKNRQLPFSPM